MVASGRNTYTTVPLIGKWNYYLRHTLFGIWGFPWISAQTAADTIPCSQRMEANIQSSRWRTWVQSVNENWAAGSEHKSLLTTVSILILHSGTSNKGPSKKGTTSQQRTLFWTPCISSLLPFKKRTASQQDKMADSIVSFIRRFNCSYYLSNCFIDGLRVSIAGQCVSLILCKVYMIYLVATCGKFLVRESS